MQNYQPMPMKERQEKLNALEIDVQILNKFLHKIERINDKIRNLRETSERNWK